MKLRIELKNLKGVFASVWFNKATSDRLFFASVEIDKKLFVDSSPVEKFVIAGHMTSATRVPTTNEGREERAWERGCPFARESLRQPLFLSSFI